MSDTTEVVGLRAYAAMMNTLDVSRLEPHLAEDFVYESQWVLQPLETKQAFLEYMEGKLETLRQHDVAVYGEMGEVEAYGRKQQCVVLAQNSRSELVGLVMAKADGAMLNRLDLCMIPPASESARTGDYPD